MGLGMVGLRYGISENAGLYGNVDYLWKKSCITNGMLEIKSRIKAYQISIRD